MRDSVKHDKKTGMTRRFVLELQDRQTRFCQMMYEAFCVEANTFDTADFDTVMKRIVTKTGLNEGYVRKTFWRILDDEFVDGDGKTGYSISLDEDSGRLRIVSE